MTLVIAAEQSVGMVLVRWVRAPRHLHPQCLCGDADVMVVSTADVGLWVPAAVVPSGADRAEVLDGMVGPEGELGAGLCAAAFGQPWERLTVLMLGGQLALLAALEEATLDVLSGLEPLGVLGMRRGLRVDSEWAGAPDVVRALRLMRDYAGARQ